MRLQTCTVALGDRSYPILVGPALLGDRSRLTGALGDRSVLLITDTNVGPLYSPLLRATLAGCTVVEVVVPAGEGHKTLGNVARILDVMVANRFSRDACVLALGGGVVGDLAGFAAAVYQRGVDFVQLPTTLLAMVDSSVGGKTGVNHPGGKNLIGAFKQPMLVLADTATLETLPDRELRAGLAEVVKYGLICDPEFFGWVEANAERLLARDPQVIADAIRRSCEIKAAIVARDEREEGERALLNLGHTFGHAIESATRYEHWLHGEAVAAGLAMAATMSQRLSLISTEAAERVERLLMRLGLPTRAPDVPRAAARERMSIDKKVKAGRLRLVLLRDIGSAFITSDFDPAALEHTLEAHLA